MQVQTYDPAAAAAAAAAAENHQHTTKQTYVTTETSDRMPDIYHDGSGRPIAANRHSAGDDDDDDDASMVNSEGHRLRRKYTTTTVTTVTTTTILLPRMQEAVIFDPVTQYTAQQQQQQQQQQQPLRVDGGGAGQVRAITAPGQAQSSAVAAVTQPWQFNQGSTSDVHHSAPARRPPTLQELGITSYFDRGSANNNNNNVNGNGNGNVNGNGGAAAPSQLNGYGAEGSGRGPVVWQESREEVEGGTAAYYSY